MAHFHALASSAEAGQRVGELLAPAVLGLALAAGCVFLLVKNPKKKSS
jgi:hypothetical protein